MSGMRAMPHEYDRNLYSTVVEARQWFHPKAHTLEGARCPCCDRVAAVRRRSISATMVRDLSELGKLTAREGDGFYHFRRFCPVQGDFAKLHHFQMIERPANHDPKKSSTGSYRLLPAGWAFLRGELKLPSAYLLYLNDTFM